VVASAATGLVSELTSAATVLELAGFGFDARAAPRTSTPSALLVEMLQRAFSTDIEVSIVASSFSRA